jgi:hypothetical protein
MNRTARNAQNSADGGLLDGASTTGSAMLHKQLAHFAVNKWLRIKRPFGRWRWVISYKFVDSNADGACTPAGMARGWREFAEIQPAPDTFWADPFPIAVGGRHYIFFEEYLYPEKRGRLSVVEVTRDGQVSESVPVLDKPYHLSYPNVFTHDGQILMIPEQSETGEVQLWRCTEFPSKWELECVMIRGRVLCDATPVRIGDTWWLFAAGLRGRRDHIGKELHIFSSDDLVSDQWRPHAANPTKIGTVGVRPAGSFFREDGQLFRPTQNSDFQYGYGIRINRIEALSHATFREKGVLDICPDVFGRYRGLHTLNLADGLVVMDGLLYEGRDRVR